MRGIDIVALKRNRFGFARALPVNVFLLCICGDNIRLWCSGVCEESKGIGDLVSVHCTTTIGEESIGFGWGRGISNIAEDTVVRWDELHSSWIVGIDGDGT